MVKNLLDTTRHVRRPINIIFCTLLVSIDGIGLIYRCTNSKEDVNPTKETDVGHKIQYVDQQMDLHEFVDPYPWKMHTY